MNDKIRRWKKREGQHLYCSKDERGRRPHCGFCPCNPFNQHYRSSEHGSPIAKHVLRRANREFVKN